MFDLAYLGKLGAVPGWPGDDSCPPQPMVAQIDAVLMRYSKASGASVHKEVWEGVGHGPLIERSEKLAELMREVIGAGAAALTIYPRLSRRTRLPGSKSLTLVLPL